MMSSKKGFTLIELLIVIAIIGILSAVVLGQLGTARNRGADATIKSNLTNMKPIAENLYDASTGSNGYNAVCANSNITAMKASAEAAAGTSGTCRNAVGYWVVYVPLKTNSAQAWCVDYLGISKQISATPGTINNCP